MSTTTIKLAAGNSMTALPIVPSGTTKRGPSSGCGIVRSFTNAANSNRAAMQYLPVNNKSISQSARRLTGILRNSAESFLQEVRGLDDQLQLQQAHDDADHKGRRDAGRRRAVARAPRKDRRQLPVDPLVSVCGVE